MIDKQHLAEILTAYKKNFVDTGWKYEKYKWEAVKTFQDNWDIDAENFAGMLKESLSKTGNLLGSNHHFPRKMIKDLAKDALEEVRAMFVSLFDESGEFTERISQFKKRAAELRDKYEPEAKNHFQDENSISTYLWLRYPDKYYIYKLTNLKITGEELKYEYKFKERDSANNLKHFLELNDEICEYLKTDQELIDLLKSHLTDTCYPDPEYKTLTVDVAYFIGTTYKSVPHVVPKPTPQKQVGDRRYWWMNADPKTWQFSNMNVGEEQFYTLYSDNGNKRHVFQNFLDARPGDIVIGYETTPVKQIVAICEITKEQDGKNLWFKKTESLVTPIDYNTVKEIKELAGMEPLKGTIGSLFKLTKDEYDIIMDVIRELNPVVPNEESEKYGREDFLKDVYLSGEKYDRMVAVLRNKKNIILQGAPGVGKTFAAKRLAYSIIGEKDESRVQSVQFHQNYSYEDFMMGYRPSGEGFKLEHGIFYDFCRTASNSPDKEYFFIIDEINRGNMSKIFGELLMLIEADHRGEKIKLASTGELFSVPENLYIIGMMNTADRSLAMIDYALRRRFSFFTMEPAFGSKGFQSYQKHLGSGTFDSLIEKVKELNKAIREDKSLGKGFCIGHSYFCNWKECTDEKMAQVIESDILPMIEEYWFDESSKYEEWEKEFRSILK